MGVVYNAGCGINTTAYDVLLQYFWAYVDEVQTANYYYSKTQYFQYIKDEYGQYTYDVLVGKFIHLSNQFKDMFALTEWHMYGSSRLGVHKPKAVMLSGAEEGAGRELVHIEFEGTWNQYTESVDDTSNTTTTTYQMSYDYFTLTRGEKNYEMVNHLGNVLVIISDKKLKTCTGDTVNYYMADVLQATDYSAFHATLKDRVWYADANNKYRFGGSNGQERDDELSGEGRSYSAEFWQYSPDLGRRFNVDPITKAHESPYATFANNPIYLIDINGADTINVVSSTYDSKGTSFDAGGNRSDPLVLFKAYTSDDRKGNMTARDFYSQYQTYSNNVYSEHNGQYSTRAFAEVLEVYNMNPYFGLAVSIADMGVLNDLRQKAIDQIKSEWYMPDAFIKSNSFGQKKVFDIKRKLNYLTYVEGAGIFESDFIGNVFYGSVWSHFQSIEQTIYDGNAIQNPWSVNGANILFGVDDPFDALALTTGYYYGQSCINIATFKTVNTISFQVESRSLSNAVYLNYNIKFNLSNSKKSFNLKSYVF